MALVHRPSGSHPQQWQRLEHCWQSECDIDPLILRARALRRLSRSSAARAVEQELLPLV